MLKKISQPLLIAFSSLAMLTVFFVIHACKKLDRQPETKPEVIRQKFFSIQPGTDPTVIAIAERIKRQDSKYNFVPDVVKKAGYPIWHKAKVATSGGQLNRVANGEQQVFIPFVVDSIQQTKALLTVKIDGGDTITRILYSNQYTVGGFDTTDNGGMWSAQEVFGVFTLFDKDIFGHTKFNVYDGRLLGATTDNIGNAPKTAEITEAVAGRQGQQPTARSMITIWITYVVCEVCLPARNTAPSGRFPYCCNATYQMVPVLYWIDDEDPLPGGWWDGGGGGGGCQEPCGPCPGCDWTQTNPCEEQDPNAPQVPCDDQWQPVTQAVADPFDPDKYDSVTVSDDLLDSFPCVAALIKDTLFDVSKASQREMLGRFSLSKYDHFRFAVDWTLDSTADEVAHTTRPRSTTINGRQHWFDTIKFNPYFLKKMSKEKLVATILHECIHGYINWCWNQYNRNNGAPPIDSNYIKAHFPIFWSYFINKSWTGEAHHELMARNYVNFLKDQIYQFGNPAASDSLRQVVAKYLAMGGLNKTSAWGAIYGLDDTCKIKSINYAGQYNQNYPTNAYPGTMGAPCFTLDEAFKNSLGMLRGDSCQ